MQTWRGVPSHFNEETSFDATVFSLMGMLVSLIALTIVAVTIRAFLRLDAAPSLALAIRLGLLLMLVSQAVGAQMIAEGGNTFGGRARSRCPTRSRCTPSRCCRRWLSCCCCPAPPSAVVSESWASAQLGIAS